MAYQSEIEKLTNRWNENPDQYFAPLADAYRKSGDLDMALEVVRAGLQKRPNYLSAHIVLGRCLVDQQNDPEASKVFQHVLELDAENIIALRYLGEITERGGVVRCVRGRRVEAPRQAPDALGGDGPLGSLTAPAGAGVPAAGHSFPRVGVVADAAAGATPGRSQGAAGGDVRGGARPRPHF